MMTSPNTEIESSPWISGDLQARIDAIDRVYDENDSKDHIYTGEYVGLERAAQSAAKIKVRFRAQNQVIIHRFTGKRPEEEMEYATLVDYYVNNIRKSTEK